MSTFQGRKTSWVSRWHAFFHTAKYWDIPGTPQGFQKSRPAKICNTSVKSSLLVSKRWQPEIAPALFQSERLPPELILEITRYLSLSSALSLSYTCKRFRQTVEAKVEDLDYLIDMQSFLKDPKESQGQRKVVLERLAFLCLLERNGRLSASKAACGGCKTTHSSPTQLFKRGLTSDFAWVVREDYGYVFTKFGIMHNSERSRGRAGKRDNVNVQIAKSSSIINR